MTQACRFCGARFESSHFLVCSLCHLVLILKTFPSNCFTKAYHEKIRGQAVRAAAV